MSKICPVCGNEFTAKRTYCSNRCRMLMRARVVKQNHIKEVQSLRERMVIQREIFSPAGTPEYLHLRSEEWLSSENGWEPKYEQVMHDLYYYMYEHCIYGFQKIEIMTKWADKIQWQDKGDNEGLTAKGLLSVIDGWYQSIPYQDYILRIDAIAADGSRAEIWKRILPE